MTEIMPVPRNLILLSYQQGAFGAEVFSLFALPLMPPQVHVLLFECAAYSAGLSVFGWY